MVDTHSGRYMHSRGYTEDKDTGKQVPIKYNIILVCDVCLEELVLPEGRGTEEQMKGWYIPDLINEGDKPLSASSVICLCPKHH